MNPKIHERENSYVVDTDAFPITRIYVDNAITLESSEGDSEWLIRIEEPFSIKIGSKTYDCSIEKIESICIVLSFLRKKIDHFDFGKNGHLKIFFYDNEQLVVKSNEQYEAWEVAGPNGLRIVSLPGGSLNIWGLQS